VLARCTLRKTVRDIRPDKIKTALVLCRALVLLSGFAVLAPAFATAPAVGDQQQVAVPGPDAEEPAQQAAQESSEDTASSAVPPTSASTGSGRALKVGAVPATNFSLVHYGMLAVIATLFTGLLVWRLRSARGGNAPSRRRASGKTTLSSKTQPF